MARTKTKDLAWPTGVVFQTHTRQNARGEVEEIATPYLRVRFTDEDGERRAIWHQVKSPEHAQRVREKINAKLAAGEADEFLHARKTFNDLAKFYQQHYLKAAVFVDGRKVSGMRSLPTLAGYLKVLRAHFGKRHLNALTYNQLELFKAKRLATPIISKGKNGVPSTDEHGQVKERPRTITSVNRELQLLRAMLNVALRERWLKENPFNRGKGLISGADERQRERILSAQEEARLLAACAGDDARRQRLRVLIITALDTGMRFGELRRLTWRQIDFKTKEIFIHSTHTKNQRERLVGLSSRLAAELTAWRALHPNAQPLDLVFGITTTVKTAWQAARTRAGLPDVRLHDLRHTNATRIERSRRVSTAQLGRLLGHSNPRTTYRYVNQDAQIIRDATSALDEINKATVAAAAEAQAEAQEVQSESEAVN